MPPFSCLFNFSLSLNFYICHNCLHGQFWKNQDENCFGMSTRRLFTGHCKAEAGMGWRTQKFTWSGKDQNSQKKKKSSTLHENAPIVSKNHARKAGVAVESGSHWLWDGNWKHSPLYKWHYPQSLLRYMAQKLIKGEI